MGTNMELGQCTPSLTQANRMEQEFDKSVGLTILKALPVIFVIAMFIEHFVVGRIATNLVGKFSEDIFKA